MQRWTRRGVLASGLALAACALESPSLVRMYGSARPGTQPPLILIPGAFGSSLRDRVTAAAGSRGEVPVCCAIHSSSLLTSRALCQRSSGSLLRQRPIT